MMQQMLEMMHKTQQPPKKFKRRNPQLTKYCWTHGGCTHNSPDCQAKAPGHHIVGTFQNQMGGSNAYYLT